MAFFSVWKPFKRIAICFLALAIALTTIYSIWSWRIGADLETHMTTIRSQGYPATLAELATPQIAPEINALTFMHRALADAIKIENELQSIEFERGQFLSEADQARIQDALTAYPSVVPLLETAAKCKTYRADADFSMKPNEFLDVDLLGRVQSPRNIARVLQKQIALSISKSRFDEAAGHGLTLVRIAEHITNEPTIVQYLVSVSIRGIALSSLAATLQRGDISADVRVQLESELAKYDDSAYFAKALISERAFGNSMCQELPWPWRRWFQMEYLKGMQNRIDLAPKTYRDFIASKVASKVSSSTLGFSMVEPAIVAAREATARNQALSRALRVLNAIQASPAIAHSDHVDLSNLGLPADTITDPFTEQPLIVRKQGSGWLIYSVGRDLKDDGGDVDGKDNGIAPLD